MRDKGIVLPLVLLSVLVIAVVLVIFFRFNFKPTSSPSSTSETIIQKSYFQQLLSNYCESKTMKINELPIQIDQTKLEINNLAVICFAGEGKAYVSINFDNNERLYIYDDNSEELGHGGEPFLGSVGTAIKKGENYTVAFYLSGGHGAAYVGESSVEGRGTRKILLENNQIIYVNYEKTLIKEDDTRLISLLKNYAIQIEGIPNEFYIDEEGYDDEIFSTFFSDLSNVEDPEKTAISRIEQILSLVEAK